VKVALTVDATMRRSPDIVEVLQPDILQLHGRETVARLRDIKQKFGLQVMKALAVETAADLASLPFYAAVADRILFDARAPKEPRDPAASARYSTGMCWKISISKLPFMVSGGLNAGNVAEAVRVTRAGGVDVSSGVERTPGIKDPEMIRSFIRAARMIDKSAALAVTGERQR
jgi:phosphoribosylanthranilate isomerase